MKNFYLLLLVMLPLITACDSQSAVSASPISSAEVIARISSTSPPVILDVRSEEEYSEGHIPGARHIAHDMLASRLDEISMDRNSEIIVYCHSGKRARKAEAILEDGGFTNIRDLEGHWESWLASGFKQK